ncbi:GLPGLI family protein [Dyadobacter jejuensis]|uniref:GLPGLI family protein n=1 Tax=Dyadobacter jejuensis TaxID=1082580 RepID=A0A316AG20_9BACT|nr:GLPGLI family protein [Dyadobacter jejuensis]PWJ56561.1 GLPGLI family protein [Dyadobacter jejuensis]
MNLLLAVILCFLIPETPNFRVQYHLVFSPDSTNINRKMEENFYLDIKEMKESYFYSENFGKSDSIKALINSALLSPQEYMADPKYRYKTMFDQFTTKKYDDRSIQVYEKLVLHQYVYPLENTLKWTIGGEQVTLAGFNCTKATTHYAGRDYIAWFTEEIPIPDGPYVFWGLPGLVVKVSDTKENYVFTLTGFSKNVSKIKEAWVPSRKGAVISTHRDKVFSIREANRRDPLEALTRATGRSMEHMTFNGEKTDKEAMRRKRAWDNNPLELE